MEGTDGVSLDPHVHSEDSYDGKEPVELILEHADDIGLDAVAITDHDEFEEATRAKEMEDEYDVTVVRGVEVSTAAGHLLALGVEERPEDGMSLDKTIERVRELGGVAVIPHPFQRTRHGIKKKRIKKARDPDGMETYNSWLFTGYRNRRAKKFASHRDLPQLAGSDSHTIVTLGRAHTELHMENDDPDADEIIQAIEEGETEISGRRVPLYRSAYHYGKAVLRKINYGFKTVTGKLR